MSYKRQFVEYRTRNVELRSDFIFQYFDIHYSLYGILRFTAGLKLNNDSVKQ